MGADASRRVGVRAAVVVTMRGMVTLPAPAGGRARRRLMLSAAGVTVAVVVAVLGLPRPSSVPVPLPVPGAADVAAARAALGFVPYTGTPPGWTLTQARLRIDTSGLPAWSLDYLTEAGRAVGLEQVTGWTPQWQRSLTHGGAAQGTVTAAGRRYQVFFMPERRVLSWLLREGNHTTLVLVKDGAGRGDGDATRLAEALRPAA
jgi:Protein of unknown function (DUF4245)